MVTAERVRQLAKNKGWSVRELFRRMGADATIVNAWEKGTASPEKHLPRLAELLESNVSYLRGETDDPSPENQKPTVRDDRSIHPSNARLLELIYELDEGEAAIICENAETLIRRRKK